MCEFDRLLTPQHAAMVHVRSRSRYEVVKTRFAARGSDGDDECLSYLTDSRMSPSAGPRCVTVSLDVHLKSREVVDQVVVPDRNRPSFAKHRHRPIVELGDGWNCTLFGD